MTEFNAWVGLQVFYTSPTARQVEKLNYKVYKSLQNIS